MARAIVLMMAALLGSLSAAAAERRGPATPPATAPAQAQPFDPTSAYEVRQVEGWKVLVNRRLSQGEPDLCARTLELLRFQLFQVTRVVPAEALAKLREVPIWVELRDKRHPCMCYHPSAGWLRANGYNPEKAGSVELANARNFLTWTVDQPWMVLHELAHAYHHRVLGHGHREVREAFEAAKAAGTYDSVLHINGRKQRHYALSNVEEYFAEASEALFGTNDFFPFVRRSELATHDPKGYDAVRRAWGLEARQGGPGRPATRPARD